MPVELEQRHQAFIHTYNTTEHQGLLKDRRVPLIPLAVLGTAKGRLYPQDGLAHVFSQGLLPQTTNRHGCVTLHSYHFYVEAGLPQTRVLLWVSDEHLRAAFENVSWRNTIAATTGGITRSKTSTAACSTRRPLSRGKEP
jgi:hypothetical protein